MGGAWGRGGEEEGGGGGGGGDLQSGQMTTLVGGGMARDLLGTLEEEVVNESEGPDPPSDRDPPSSKLSLPPLPPPDG